MWNKKDIISLLFQKVGEQMIDKTRAGILKKNLHGDMAYKSFCPSDLPPTPPIEINDKISDLKKAWF